MAHIRTNETLPPILIAEDDDNDFFFFERRLDRSKIKNPIVRFPDGEQAIAYLQSVCGLPLKERPLTAAVLFLDIKMPRVNGFEVLRWIRAQADMDWLRIIMLSGSGEPGDVAHASELGADRYLVKYPPKDELTAAIDAHAAHRTAGSDGITRHRSTAAAASKTAATDEIAPVRKAH